MLFFSSELVHAIELVLTLDLNQYNKNISKLFRSQLKVLKSYISGIHSKSRKSSSTTQSMSSKRSSYNPVLPKKRMDNSDSMQQFNRLNFNKQHLGIHTPTTHRYNSNYMRNKYNQRNDQDWETQSQITPILEDPFGGSGQNLYKSMKDNLKPAPKFVKKSSKASSSSSDTTQKKLRAPTPIARSSASKIRLSALSDIVFEDDREDDECSVIINASGFKKNKSAKKSHFQLKWR